MREKKTLQNRGKGAGTQQQRKREGADKSGKKERVLGTASSIKQLFFTVRAVFFRPHRLSAPFKKNFVQDLHILSLPFSAFDFLANVCFLRFFLRLSLNTQVQCQPWARTQVTSL